MLLHMRPTHPAEFETPVIVVVVILVVLVADLTVDVFIVVVLMALGLTSYCGRSLQRQSV